MTCRVEGCNSEGGWAVNRGRSADGRARVRSAMVTAKSSLCERHAHDEADRRNNLELPLGEAGCHSTPEKSTS